jgi:hypothetical protein
MSCARCFCPHFCSQLSGLEKLNAIAPDFPTILVLTNMVQSEFIFCCSSRVVVACLSQFRWVRRWAGWGWEELPLQISPLPLSWQSEFKRLEKWMRSLAILPQDNGDGCCEFNWNVSVDYVIKFNLGASTPLLRILTTGVLINVIFTNVVKRNVQVLLPDQTPWCVG